jgi:hypothetical protein
MSRRQLCGAIATVVALRIASCDASGPSVDVDDHRTQTTSQGGGSGPSQ